MNPHLVMLAKQAIILYEQGEYEKARQLFVEVSRHIEREEARTILQKRPKESL